MKLPRYFFIFIAFVSCKPTYNHDKSNPNWMDELNNGIEVNHSSDTVYATQTNVGNQAYELVFETVIKSKSTNIKILEFGVYLNNGVDWQFHSPTGEPYTSTNFADWYNCQDSILEKKKRFRDKRNRLLKTNSLNKDTISTLWYYLGEDDNGIQYVGYDKIVGIVDTLR